MATPVQTIIAPSPIPARIHNSCDFVQTLMKLQRAAQLITSTLDLEDLIERVTNDLALAIDNGKVSVWLRDPETNDMVLRGIHGRTQHSHKPAFPAHWPPAPADSFRSKPRMLRYHPVTLLAFHSSIILTVSETWQLCTTACNAIADPAHAETRCKRTHAIVNERNKQSRMAPFFDAKPRE